MALPYPEDRPTVPVWPDAGEALGLSRSSTYAAAERGEIPVIHLGRRIVVPTAALRRLLQLDDAPATITEIAGNARPCGGNLSILGGGAS